MSISPRFELETTLISVLRQVLPVDSCQTIRDVDTYFERVVLKKNRISLDWCGLRLSTRTDLANWVVEWHGCFWHHSFFITIRVAWEPCLRLVFLSGKSKIWTKRLLTQGLYDISHPICQPPSLSSLLRDMQLSEPKKWLVGQRPLDGDKLPVITTIKST